MTADKAVLAQLAEVAASTWQRHNPEQPEPFNSEDVDLLILEDLLCGWGRVRGAVLQRLGLETCGGISSKPRLVGRIIAEHLRDIDLRGVSLGSLGGLKWS